LFLRKPLSDNGHWIGACTYSLLWKEPGKVAETACTLTTSEEITEITSEGHVSGLSGKIDWKPRNDPVNPQCPTDSETKKEFHLVPKQTVISNEPGQRDWDDRDAKALNSADQTLSLYSLSDQLMRMMLEANRSNPAECHVYISEATHHQQADVVLAEELESGQTVLVLRACDTNEALHKIPKTTKTTK
jgi:hypothetical protein